MKQLLLKTWLIFACLLILGGGKVWAEDETITLANGVGTGSGTSYSITWSGTSCDITQTKENSSTSVSSSYISAPRWYLNHKIAFKAKSGYTLTGATIECTSNDYATALKNSTFSNGASATSSAATVTITTSGDFDITMGAQSRIKTITVSYTSNGGGGGGGSDPSSYTHDVLTNADLAATGTTYTDFSNVSKNTAVYAGNSAKNNGIQLRSNNSNSGIVSTTSGGKIKTVTVTWNSNTAADRTIDVYGSNAAYSTAADLYNNTKQGTKLGSIVKGTSTSVTVTGDYAYVGIRSNSGSLNIDDVDFAWEDGGDTPEKTLTALAVSGTPTKTTYTAGDSFEPAGLTVTGHYDDDSNETITEGITWSTPAALTTGQTSVSITATVNGVTSAAYNVTGLTVNAPVTLNSITLGGELAKTTYTIGDAFDRTGLTITANYSDDSHVDVTGQAEWAFDPETFTTAGANINVDVYATFGGQEIDVESYIVTVNKKTANISFAPATIELGIEEYITLAPTTTPADAEISYTIESGSEYISINDDVVTGVAEGTAVVRADYAGNSQYEAASAIVTINVSNCVIVTQTGFDSLGENMTDDTNGEDTNLLYVAEKGDAGTAPAIPTGTNYIRLYQNGGKITIKGVKGIHILSASLTTGETYETTTIAHVADPDEDTTTPTTGTSVAKNTTYTASDINCNSITFYCLGTDKNTRIDVAALSVKYTKEVIELSSIALSGTYKTEFVQNSTFNHDGVVVTAIYSDDDTQIVTARAEFSEPNMTTTGTKTVTVSYTEGDVTKTATYDITIVAEEVTAIKLSGEYQTTFRVGETFNHDNLVVKADYNSGRTNIDVTSNAEVSEPDMSTAGEKTVTVSFGGQEKTYTIKVIPANAIFYESFDQCDGYGGNEKDGQTIWNTSAGSATLITDNSTDGNKWSFTSGGGAYMCAKLGAGSTKGIATTPKLGYTGNAVLIFKSAAWDANSETCVVNLSIVGGGKTNITSISNKKGEWTTYTVLLTGLTNDSQVEFAAANNNNNRFFLDEVLVVEANELNLVATDGETYYATFSSTENVEFAGAEVYTITVENDVLALNEVENKQVPTGNGVLIKSFTNKVPYIYVYEAEELGSNMLKACPTNGVFKAEADGNYYYKLAYGDNNNKTKLGFWWGANDGSGNFSVKAGGAVLVVPQSAGVRGFSFTPEEVVTGVSCVNSQNNQDSIYSLQGQRMLKLQRGVNIVNGRKIIR